MVRIRVAVGILGVAAGTALATGGVHGLRAVAHLAMVAAPIILIAAGLVALLRTLAPITAWTGPAVLVLIGLVWLTLRGDLVRGLPQSRIVAVMLIVSGVLVAAIPNRREPQSIIGSRPTTALLFPRTLMVDVPPRRLSVQAILTQVTIDLTSVTEAGSKVLEVDTCILGGRILLLVPVTWRIEPGRLHATYWMNLSGIVEEPAQQKSGDPTEGRIPPGRSLELHIVGFGGSVALVRAI